MKTGLRQGLRAVIGPALEPAGMRWGGRMVLLAALALGAGVPAKAQTASESAPAATAQRFSGPASFAKLADAALPAVVNVSSTHSGEGAESGPQRPQLPPGSPFEEFFRKFFGDQFPDGQFPGPPSGELMALGSGFIVDPQGYIVTNNHVIEGADEITVTLHDDTELVAKVVGHDPRTDLALLKVETDKPLPAVEWGDSDAAQVGDWVMAVGNPFGLGGTVTTGIISARARDINAGPYDDFLQTDASINRGNSGGPLFDMNGKVIGVNTAIFSPSGGNIGIGFAVPSTMAKSIIQEIKETGTVRRGWLGVSIQPVTEEIAEALGLREARGALIAQVLENTPAAEAGLETGDVVLSFDGQEIGDPDELSRVVAKTPTDKTVKIGILRNGERQTVQARIALLQDQEQVARGAEPAPPEERTETGALGLSLAKLSPELRQEYGISADASGVLVLDVAQDSAAAAGNIAPGDVITKVGQKTVSQPEEVVAAIEEARKADQRSVLLLRERDGNPAFVALPTAPERG